ncbi:MAG: glycosyltransferase family 2 protein [Candidatus Omnitrophica bacterium]|nr:glycosyltransferase family 2 protein [Candidatus Omnitrophota bacterium]
MNQTEKKETLIIIPVFNEEKNIPQVIDELKNSYKDMDILVVNDSSADKTLEKIENKDVFILNHCFNMGIGASLETAFKFAVREGYKYVVRIDGDGQHDINFIKDILNPVKNGGADIVVGSRFLGKSEFKSSFIRLIGIHILSFLLSCLTKKAITDPTSGFCAMNKKAFEFFSRNCVEDYPEPEILIYHKDFIIKEVPVSIVKRKHGVSSITPLKSVYYMTKVLLSLFVHIFKKEAQ